MNANLDTRVEVLNPQIGAVIHGIDVGKHLNAQEVDTIHNLWMQHQVIFFRNQELTPEQHLNFARQLRGVSVSSSSAVCMRQSCTDGDSYRLEFTPQQWIRLAF